MRIMHAVHCFPPEPAGGTERVAAGLVAGLAARGHQLQVVAGSLDWQAGAGLSLEEWQGVQVFRIRRDDPWFDRWDNGWNPEVETLWRNLLREQRPDLVHVHHWIRLTRNLVQVAAQEGVPVLVQLHDFQATCPRTFRLPAGGGFCRHGAGPAVCLDCVQRWPFQGDGEIRAHLDHYIRDMVNELRCARIRVALSAAQEAHLNDFLGEPVGPIGRLPAGAARVLVPRGGHQPGEVLKVAHWGNLYDLKGVEVLLRAVGRAAGETPLELHVYGEAQTEEYRRRLEGLAAGEAITLHGHFAWEELEGIEADLAVFPSLCQETYGLVVDEACMLGLPMVVADSGALPERIGSGGVVVPPGDEDALTQVLVRLGRDRGELARLAAGVPRSWATADEVAGLVEGMYETMLAGGGESLPPLAPVTDRERLELCWYTAAARLASLAGSPVGTPPPWRE